MYAILVVLIAATASSEILSGECPKTFPKGMRPIWKCCRMENNPDAHITDEQHAVAEYCYKNVNNSKVDPGTPASEYDCMAECIFIKLGLMGEDKTLHEEKVLKEINDQLHEDFHEASTKAFGTCIGKKYNTRCPTGIDGMITCYSIQLMLECPAHHWTDGEDCKETRKYVEKCGDTMWEDPDYYYD